MNKEINLIGLNLYSIFLALKIKKDFKNYDVRIIEASNNFLKAYQPLKIKNYYINPGFHAFENVRSNKLIFILRNLIKFKKLNKTRGVIIGNNIVSYTDDFKFWPKEIIRKFKLKKKLILIDPLKNITKSNKKYLKYLTSNYFGKEVDIKDAFHSAYPWFFPPNYQIVSNDEANIFNKKIRKNKIKHTYIFPRKGLFNEVSSSLKKLLKKKKIKIQLNNPIKFYKIKKQLYFDGCNDLNNQNKKIICVPVAPLSYSIRSIKQKFSLTPIKYYTGLVEISNFVKSDLDRFTEIITSSEFAYGLTRISLYSDIFDIKKKIYQIEFIEHSSEKNIEVQLNKIITFMSKFIEFKSYDNLNIKLIDYVFVRNVFRPKKKC